MTLMAKISTSLVLYLSCSILPGLAQSTRLCNVDDLFRDWSSELDGYERLKKPLRGKSTEGGNVEYYYSTGLLKAIEAVYYGETGKTEYRYYFATPTRYLAKFARYYYSVPIFRPHPQIMTRLKSEFVVCHGEPPRGHGDDPVPKYFELTSRVLRELLAVAPRR